MVGICSKASLQVWLQWHIYDYSFKEDELNAMPILVQKFFITTTTFATWWWMNNWRCSNASQITSAIKASFVVLRKLTQKMLKWIRFQLKDVDNVNRKQNLSMQTYPSWIISKSWYFDYFFFFLVAFIGFQCPTLNTPCNFEGFYIPNFACSNCFNKVVIFFKLRPCTLWDEPQPPCQNANDVQQCVKG